MPASFGPQLPWLPVDGGASPQQSCTLGWSVIERTGRQGLRRHAVLCTVLQSPSVPHPVRWLADAQGLHYDEVLDSDGWPPRLSELPPGPDSAASVQALGLALGRVLQALERQGIEHGRLSPDTVRWQPASAQAWLTDFDLGRFIHAPEDPRSPSRHRCSSDLVSLGRLLAWRASADARWLDPSPPDLDSLDRWPLDAFLKGVLRDLLQTGDAAGYRSARALCEDLVAGTLRPRPAGLGRPPAWRLPMERIGRATEHAQMRRACAEVAQAAATPASALVVVDGRSGIGKTSVIEAACRSMASDGARVAAGKFNQYGSQSPVAALMDALDDALSDLAGQAPADLSALVKPLRDELGAMAGVLTPTLPWLEQLIGPQPPAPELGAEASRTRFELALRRLVVALSAGPAPLVLFVDDLQWADPRTLELLGGLLAEPRLGRLLLIGAYRSETVGDGHPLPGWLERLAAQPSVRLQRIQVQAWRADDIAELLQVSGVQPGEALIHTAQALARHSDGNPFATLQLLRAAEHERAITADPGGAGWQIDLTRLQGVLDGRSVVSLVQSRLRGLPEATQAALSDAAHLGAEWSIEALAGARGTTPLQACRDLAPALSTGLVVVIDDDRAVPQALTLRFLHDVVQQAAYEQVAPAQRDALRVRLGTGLLRHARDQGHLDQFLFAIVQQFNGVEETPVGGLDAATSALLNERAGQLASAQGASAPALEYFLRAARASALADEAPAASQTLALHCRAAEAACAAARFDVANELLTRASALPATPADSARIAELRVLLLLARNRLPEALALGQATLNQLGMPLLPLGDPGTWPRVPAPGTLELSQPSPAVVDSAQRLLVALTPCAFITSFEMYARVIRSMIELAVQWPASAWTPLAWTNYGLTLCGMERRTEAFEASELALSMLGRIQDAALRCKVRVLCLGFLRHWRLPLAAQLTPLLQAYEDCQVSGDQEYLGYAAFLFCDKAWGVQPLDELLAGHTLRTTTVQQFGHDFSHHHCRVWQQGLMALRGDAATTPLQLDGPAFRSDEDLAHLQAAQNGFSLFTAHTLRAALAWYRGEPEACWLACQQALPVSANGTGTVLSVDLQVLAALSAPPFEATAFRDRLAAWADVAPANLQHKLDLVDAVLTARSGRLAQALPLFERARDQAQAGGFLRDQLLIEQACSEALADAGQREGAQHWFSQAWRSGLRWGALAVVERLLARHAERMAALAAPAPPAATRPTARAFDLARVSHDMRNPISGVMGLTSILLASNLDERQRRLATLTKASAESLLGMVNDIMDLGQLEHGQLRLHHEPVDLRQLADHLIELMRVQNSRGQVELRLLIDAAVPAQIHSDGQRLRQVIGNFLSNAMKFTRQGHVALRIAPADLDGQLALRVSVQDTGAGIAEHEQAPIFSAFYQSSSGTAYQGPSSGMGLAVSKGIVEALGGRIGFHSTLGQGSEFWFLLPLNTPP
ncbi:AAA family ATPase [Ideonella sp. 4Y11]|uniref:Virulence sensor protein BvgS n=1 Tax=Ideonella aquatica TaxID=2824119 RepID=A0A940YJI4_9BURK|nr:AAA family ATPase [Ideonella aquatica]MBQ0960669.1 AAA family ATPase [Ideonella aquatica]